MTWIYNKSWAKSMGGKVDIGWAMDIGYHGLHIVFGQGLVCKNIPTILSVLQLVHPDDNIWFNWLLKHTIFKHGDKFTKIY